VDIGGGHGLLLANILERITFEGTLHEVVHVVEGAKRVKCEVREETLLPLPAEICFLGSRGADCFTS